MNVGLEWALSDSHIPSGQASSQRQLAVSVSALPAADSHRAPLNLCLVLDRSGSMGGSPLQTVKQAARQVIDRLSPRDRISIISFDHRAEVLVENQPVQDPAAIGQQLDKLRAGGGTAIDVGLKAGITEVAKGKQDAVSQIFLLTDGENEHGDNDRCLRLAQVATEYGLTLSSLGFGDHWNQDVLEQIADAGGGSLSYIQQPEAAIATFSQLFTRAQSVGLTNAYLTLSLLPGVRLAELKPVAQVLPETVELAAILEANQATVRLGDLMAKPRVVLVNFYIDQQPPGQQMILQLQVQYDDPTQGATGLQSDLAFVQVLAQEYYQPTVNPEVQAHIFALAKYRQTQIAEFRLQAGDRQGAVTLLQSAAQTALQMGDQNAATVLQENVTRLQAGDELSARDRKKTRIVSKTQLQ